MPLVVFPLLALMAGAPPAGADEPARQPAPEAYYQFLLSRHFESRGQIDEAIAALERAARLDPSSAEPQAELAGVYARQGRLEEARAAGEAALAVNPASVEAHRILGGVYAAVADGDARGISVPVADAIARAVGHLGKGRRRPGEADPTVDLTLGRLHMRADRPAEAAEVLRRLLDQQPDLPEAAVLLARAETAAGRPERAVEALETAAADNPRLLTSLAELYERQRRWVEAAGAYEKLAALVPRSADTRVRWASALVQVGTPESLARARELLGEATSIAPGDVRALYLLSTAERRGRDFAAAEATARRLIAASPDTISGPFALAQVYEDQRRYVEAADVLEPLVDRHKASPEPPRELLSVVVHLGYAQLQAGRAEAAILTFERARAMGGAGSFDAALIQAHLLARRYDAAADLARAARARRPADLRLVQLEARALSRAGRRDRAVVVMRDALAAHEDQVQAHLTLAEMLHEATRHAEADDVLDRAEARFPSDLSVPFQRGALLEQRKDYKGAEAAFRQVIARDPRHAPALNYLGYMLADRGDRLDEAVALVERALAVDPDNGAYLDSLGWAFFKQQRVGDAEPLLRRAAAQAPGNSVVQDHLGDVLWAAGHRQEAVAAWRRALEGDRESVDPKAIEAKIARAR